MAKLTIAGQAVVLTSNLKLEDIIKVGKYNPDALVLKDEKEKPVFAICGNHSLSGCLNDVGAEFGASDTEGRAIITILAPDLIEEEDDPKSALADMFGVGMARLNAIEETLPAVIAKIEEDKAKVVEAIEIA